VDEMTKGEAERQINAILEALEADSGCLVENISIAEVDINSISSRAKELTRSVQIDLHWLPGHSWFK
jgi:hypothetical protein